MHIGRIQGATRDLSAPVDWVKEEQGPCCSLPIRDDSTTAGPGMTSAWFPTSEEIMRIVHGAPVYLTVLGRVHPPVSMSIGPQPDLTADD